MNLDAQSSTIMGEDFLYLIDPDGIEVELVQYETATV